MLWAPPPVDDTERARSAITERAEQILEDTERDVADELDRLEATKHWAFAEMDRITERAKTELDDGMDPDEVKRRTEADLLDVIAKASDPEFDPRAPDSAPAAEASAVPAGVGSFRVGPRHSYRRAASAHQQDTDDGHHCLVTTICPRAGPRAGAPVAYGGQRAGRGGR